MKKFLDCISVVGSAPSRFQGKKKYVSTGAVATTEIDESGTIEVSYEDRPSRANLTAEAGDILFAKMQGTRKTLLLDSETEKNIYSTGFYAVRANPEVITTECLYYLVDSELFLTQKDKNCSGATQKAITNGGLAKIEIRVPPLSEQGVLTEKLRYMTQLIADKRKQLELFDEVIKSRFIEMFGDMLLNSRGWKEATLDTMADIVSGITKGRKVREKELIEVPYMAVSNVKDGYIDWTTVKTIMATKLEIEQYRLLPYDVLMTEGGDPDKLGRGAVIVAPLEDSIHQNHIFRVRLQTDMILPVFFSQYLQNPKAKKYFLGCAKQTTGIASINMNQLRSLPVLVPPLELQEQFVAFVEQVDKSKFEIQQSLEKLEILKKSLMQQYFG